jgi:hypothetical protein
MKKSRFGQRDRLSRDAIELQRLATGLSESGSKLEDAWWDEHLADLVDQLLANGAEDDLNSALDKLYEGNPRAHDELADAIEAGAETTLIEVDGHPWDLLLFAVPLLAWSRFNIPSSILATSMLDPLRTQLSAHVFAGNARIALADNLFSPDQLPRSFCDTRAFLRELGDCALAGQHLRIDVKLLPETNRFLSDIRYLIGAVAVPQGAPLFHWNEADGGREQALAEWTRQGAPLLEPLLTGCAYQPLLADAYHAACQVADRESRPYAVKASVAFLHTMLNLPAAELHATIGAFFEDRLVEYRVGFGPLGREDTYHGLVWPLLGNESEQGEVVGDIETVLRECGITDIAILHQQFPMEFCDDCGAPMYPTPEGELVHAEMPEAPTQSPHTLH